MLLRMPSGVAVPAVELALDMIVLGFRIALIKGWKWDWNSERDLYGQKISFCVLFTDNNPQSDECLE